MDIPNNKFEELLKKGYNLDIIWIIEKAKSGWDYDTIPIQKVDNLIKTAIRKGLLTEEFKLTLEGEELLKFVNTPSTEKLTKKKISNDPFVSFWSLFPANDTFEYRGRKFTGSRGLKQKKPDCKIKLDAILNEGEYTIDQILECLKLEIHQKCEKSYKEGKNHMSFMQNSCTWLNQRSFEGYMELIKKGEKIEEKRQTNETYI